MKMSFKLSVKRRLQCIQFAVIPENNELMTPQGKNALPIATFKRSFLVLT